MDISQIKTILDPEWIVITAVVVVWIIIWIITRKRP